MALPNSKKKSAATPRKVTRSRNVVRVLDHLDPNTRDAILNDILASDTKLPAHGFLVKRAEETIRIANKHGVGKMQVAGVRSALAKGIYDEYL